MQTDDKRLKRGHVDPTTGLVFWAYVSGKPYWRTKEDFSNARQQATRITLMARRANWQKHLEKQREWRKKNKSAQLKWRKANYIKNQEQELLRAKTYRDNNKDKRKVLVSAWRAKNPEKVKEQRAKWYERNRNLVIEYSKNKYRSDCLYQLKSRLRSRLRFALRCKNLSDDSFDTRKIVNWFAWLAANNHAPDWRDPGIAIDHVIPLHAFNLRKPNAAEAANNWRNLFPLSKSENSSKGAKIIPNYIQKVWRLADQFIALQRP